MLADNGENNFPNFLKHAETLGYTIISQTNTTTEKVKESAAAKPETLKEININISGSITNYMFGLLGDEAYAECEKAMSFAIDDDIETMEEFVKMYYETTLYGGDGMEIFKESIDTAIYNANLEEKELPRLLSDNGSCYISNELKSYLSDIGMGHVRGKPNHPQTQGKIERYHRSMKNIVKLHHYYSPSELENEINDWVEYYNNERYHESLSNVTPSDVYFGREEKILQKRKQTKLITIQKRRHEYLKQKLISA